ncbi:MAG: FAD-linked oxidase C-terminal domain-containing protein [Flavobacteriales bacterium]|nr:FAD-linked oxidase C-terminal domain-containing protein [Flavobacteriales bacterium]
MKRKLKVLAEQIQGNLYFDDTVRKIYATDASSYREMPLAVALPKSKQDLVKLIRFAHNESVSIIPRAAGTSLAGQVVGSGIVVDISKEFCEIIEVNEEDSYALVQPGVIRDELNLHLKPYGLFFGPETSTSNRCMLGGMVGNNACGARSLIYGSTREHLISMKVILADGNETEFKALNSEEFEAKTKGIGTVSELETQIYRQAKELFSDPGNRIEIENEFPKKNIPRRNTGYALDLLANTNPFTDSEEQFNFCKLLAGSEGTLAFTTELKVKLVPAPSKHQAVVCMHFNSINESLKGNLEALKFKPTACELIDHYILECTKENREQQQNRFFVQGEPKAILVVEFLEENEAKLDDAISNCLTHFKQLNLGQHFPVVKGADIEKVWNLRKAGLGLLSNIPGDAKPVAVIEDTAVDVNDLPSFIQEFNNILAKRNLYCVHYAHAATGELHLRPILNLKTEEGNRLYKTIATDISRLVKQYKGSLSGEHGDGRLRGEFLSFMIGEKNYQHCKNLKNTWDPKGIFNPGKIVDTPSMNESLRYMPDYHTPEFNTAFNFSKDQGMLRAAEKCNGSGDCRKTELSAGTMCPSYQATREEKHSTRARANIFREVLSDSNQENPFLNPEIAEVMELCNSCKGCKSECPSNVDMAKLKAEYSYQLLKEKGASLKDKLFANIGKANQLGALAPRAYNALMKNSISSGIVKKIAGIAKERELPLLQKNTLSKWFKSHAQKGPFSKGKIYLFNDEFTNYNDTHLGITSIKLLNALGYEVQIPEHLESGRAFISKGFLDQAKALAEKNTQLLSELVSEKQPIIGIEPSAILTLRDEYIDLAEDPKSAQHLATHTLTLEEFLAREIEAGNISSDAFTEKEQYIRLHGHCHQKALSSLTPSKIMLSLPKNYKVQLIPSGCCGMAGSFGYEKEHYEVSMKMGELVLFPTIRKEAKDTLIAAAGTSCRHQIKDGTQREALHPVEILYQALKH